MNESAASLILQGKTYLGIEFGSTRIKAVLIDASGKTLASGSDGWENQYENGVWTYSLEAVWQGLANCVKDLKENIRRDYGVVLKKTASIGISAMMHGYMPFDRDGKLLVPFRTWRNNMTAQASEILVEKFRFPIPQRWSIAHLYQAILNKEEHLPKLDFLTTLEGYVHWQLTGEKVLGIGEASGMFPVDIRTRNYDAEKITVFNEMIAAEQFPWKLEEILPRCLMSGEPAGTLTKAGALLLDPEGDLEPGIPLCPPEGDVDTGMVATNCLLPGHTHVSAGTSCFANVVMEKPVERLHPEIEMAVTPAATILAMVHEQNCTSEINAWVGLFAEFAELMGQKPSMNEIFTKLFEKSLEAEPDGGGLLSYGYLSGEHVTGFENGRPLFVRGPESRMDLANFMRTQIFTSLAALQIGLDVLKSENVPVKHVLAQGGLFKTPGVAQRVLASAMNTEVSVMETASEGGAWGMALLALYLAEKKDGQNLIDFLNEEIFANAKEITVAPTAEETAGYREFLERYKKGLGIERCAVDAGIWADQ